MNIIDLLHKGRFARDQECVWMVFPNGVLVAALLFKLAQFIERIGEIVFFQIVENAFSRDAVQITQRLRRLTLAVCNNVVMIGHYGIGEDAEFAGFASLVECVTDDLLEFVPFKDR